MVVEKADLLWSQKTSERGTSKKKRQVFSDLCAVYSDMAKEQKKAFEIARDQAELEKLRLKIYDSYQNRIIDTLLELGELLRLRQAGGRPSNEHLNLGYELLTKHYQATGEVLKPKPLSKQVYSELVRQGYKPETPESDPFSIRFASEVISLFHLSLPYEDFYKN